MEKKEYFSYSKKLKEEIVKNKNKNYEKAMAAIAAYAKMSYNWNQFYTDDEIEKTVCELSDAMFGYTSNEKTCANDDSVMFYDGFGLDTRGLAAIYAKALVQLGYKIIWITTDKSKGKIPMIEGFLKQGDAEIVYLDIDNSYTRHVKELNEQFKKYKPAQAFFYTTPDDVSAEIVFYHYRNRVKRYQINLTDHAYWLGINAFDYCIEFRDYGAGISRVQRKIPLEKIVLLPFYPLIDRSVTFQGFPFDTIGRKILFSGGSLYKTIGGGNKFYQIVEEVLKDNEDTIFLYAGSGDDSELKKLASKFVNRVQHIQERKDLFALMEHVDVYLNTYPMLGGLMTQYSAMAGKPPLILNDSGKQDSSGFLIEQESAGVEFDSVRDVVNEINHLLNDKEYRSRRAEEIKKRVISEAEFTSNLSEIMNGEARSRYAECPDTEEFRHEYLGRFSKKMIADSIVRKKNKAILTRFPKLTMAKVMNKLKH